jgi:carbon monoxide dehydrogenase subunit G
VNVAEASYTTTTRVPQRRVWDFVEEMDNWGRFVTGYQKHEKRDDRHSTWTLKGDVGVLSRTLTFAVEIVEWNGPDRVSFTLTGVNEPMQGAGTFTMATVTNGAAAAPTDATSPPAIAPRRNPLFRLLEGFWRWLLGRAGDGATRDAAATQAASAGDALTELRFELSLKPGGPMAPMVDAMIRPLMLPAAENLANRILAELEQTPS